jgi:glycosyltransferase involved in cell wall biosynthesis
VRYLAHPGNENRGISASQNLGIREAKGEYIAFLDSDDVWLPEKLDQQVAMLDAHPEAVMLYGRTHYWYSWTGEAEDASRDLIIEPGVQPGTLVMPPSLLVRFLRDEIPIPCPSDIMVRRNGVIEAGGFEEEFRRIFTDQVLYAKLCLERPVLVSSQRLSLYRKHPDSAVSLAKKRGQMRSARLFYLDWLGGYLDHHEIDNREIRSALRSARQKALYPRLSRLQVHFKYRALIAKELLKATARQTLPARIHRLVRAQQDSRVTQPR